jgi:hypothetical protein
MDWTEYVIKDYIKRNPNVKKRERLLSGKEAISLIKKEPIRTVKLRLIQGDLDEKHFIFEI